MPTWLFNLEKTQNIDRNFQCVVEPPVWSQSVSPSCPWQPRRLGRRIYGKQRAEPELSKAALNRQRSNPRQKNIFKGLFSFFDSQLNHTPFSVMLVLHYPHFHCNSVSICIITHIHICIPCKYKNKISFPFYFFLQCFFIVCFYCLYSIQIEILSVHTYFVSQNALKLTCETFPAAKIIFGLQNQSVGYHTM